MALAAKIAMRQQLKFPVRIRCPSPAACTRAKRCECPFPRGAAFLWEPPRSGSLRSGLERRGGLKIRPSLRCSEGGWRWCGPGDGENFRVRPVGVARGGRFRAWRYRPQDWSCHRWRRCFPWRCFEDEDSRRGQPECPRWKVGCERFGCEKNIEALRPLFWR